MKRTITIAALLLCLTAHAQQHVTKDAKGNYVISRRDSTGVNKPSGHTITDAEGKVHPVYVSSRGKLYWLKTAKKSGNVYKCYIKD